MSDAACTRRIPAWALLTGVTALAIGTRGLIAVAERSERFSGAQSPTPGSLAAMALAAAMGAFIGRRAINRPSGFLLGVAFAGIAALLLAGSPYIPLGLGVGAVVSLAAPFMPEARRALLATGIGALAGALAWRLAPWENGWVWGGLVGAFVLVVAGLRLPRSGERSPGRWAGLAARCAALLLLVSLMAGWGSGASNRRIIADFHEREGYLDFGPLPRVPRQWTRQAESLGFAPIRSAMISGRNVDDALLGRLARLPELSHLSLMQTTLTATALQQLAAAPALSSLHLSNCQLEAAGWAGLGQSPHLLDLRLDGVTLGDSGLAELAKLPRIQALWVANGSVTAQGMAVLRGHPALEDLGVIGPEITPTVLLELPHLPALRSFSFGRSVAPVWDGETTNTVSPLLETPELPEVAAVRGAPNLVRLRLFAPEDELLHALSRAGFARLQLHAERMESLHVDPEDPERIVHANLSYSGVSDDLAIRLQGLHDLHTIDLSGCDLTRQDLDQLLQLPALETLLLDRAGLVEDAIETLAKCPRLKCLSLRSVRSPYGPFAHLLDLAKFQPTCPLRELDLAFDELADADLRFIAPLVHLRALNLKGNPLTDAGLAHLSGMTALERLDLRETGVTAAGVQSLQTKLPTIEIHWDEK